MARGPVQIEASTTVTNLSRRRPEESNIQFVLESDQITVTVVPEEGGRISSLLSRESNLEFLMQSQHPRKVQLPSIEARFQDGPCAGIEECLPSVGACGVETEDGPVPDHGDFWQLRWQIESMPIDGMLRQNATGFSRPLRFSKLVYVKNRSMCVQYTVLNLSDATTTFLYACHPLFAVDPGDVIVLPDEVTSLSLNYSRNQRLGAQGDIVSWPGSEATENGDLSLVLPYSAGVAEMLYTDRLASGWCGLYRSSTRQGIVLRFDAELLPYLGIWLCYGAWPEGGKEPLQHAVALEPTLVPCNTLIETQNKNLAQELAPGSEFRWTIDFQLSNPDITLEAFRRFCSTVTPVMSSLPQPISSAQRRSA
jgi:galactose mutarotase-like enzyme